MTAEQKQGKDARCIILRMVANFPELADDSDNGDVNGGDLVEWVANEVFALKEDPKWAELLKIRAESGTPWCESCDSPEDLCECLGPPRDEEL